jgi:hypothetical protein
MKLNPTDFSTTWKVTLFFTAGAAELADVFDAPLAVNTPTRTPTATKQAAANRRFTLDPSSVDWRLPSKSLNRSICSSQGTTVAEKARSLCSGGGGSQP